MFGFTLDERDKYYKVTEYADDTWARNESESIGSASSFCRGAAGEHVLDFTCDRGGRLGSDGDQPGQAQTGALLREFEEVERGRVSGAAGGRSSEGRSVLR